MMYEPIVNQPVIDTGWFDLRPLRKSDQGLIDHFASDRRVAEMTPKIPHPLPPGAATDYVMRAMSEDRNEDVWAMDALRSGSSELMGLIALERMDRDHAEVAFWVAPAFWNNGVAQAAVRALVDANPLDNAAIFASVFQDNPASAKVVTQCGFDYLGDAESYCVSRDTPVPTWTYLKKLTG